MQDVFSPKYPHLHWGPPSLLFRACPVQSDRIVNLAIQCHLVTRLQLGTVTRVLAHVALWRGKGQLPLHLYMYIGLQNVVKRN